MTMTQPISLDACQVAIIGLGLMGGSVALRLRGRCRSLLAADPEDDTRQLAHRLGAVDRVVSDPAEILPQADLVVLAAPVRAILELIHRLPSLLSVSAEDQRVTVIDLGSTKVEICQAYEQLPAYFDPLGGHPMCGSERAGLKHADKELFRDAIFTLTPLERTSHSARQLALQLVEALGAHPLWLDAQTHDRWTASTSHLPYLLSVALALATPPETAPLAGPGFRSTSRLASSSPSMMADILHTNQDSIRLALGRFRAQLDRLEDTLREMDEAGMTSILNQAAEARALLLDEDKP